MRKTGDQIGSDQLDKNLLYSADIASIAQSATYNTQTYVNPINVVGVDFVAIQLYGTGHTSGAAGPVTFYILASIDGTKYSTVGTPLVLILNGVTPAVSEPYSLDVRGGIRMIKCLQVVNGDASHQVDTVNGLVYATQ